MFRLAAWGYFVFALIIRGAVFPIPIHVNGTGLVSLALCDSNGTMVRSLAYAEPINSDRTFFWDATDDMGFPVAPARYSTRAVFFTNPPSLKFQMKVGAS